MSPTIGVSCRVDFRPAPVPASCDQTGRVESLSATGCTILTRDRPKPGTTLELRVYLPGGDWPLRVDHATVTWSHWDCFTVEFLSIPARDQQRLRTYLSEASTLATDCDLASTRSIFYSGPVQQGGPCEATLQ